MQVSLPVLSHPTLRRLLVGVTMATTLALALFATPAHAQWPTSCVELNDTVERRLGNTANVGIYQRVFGERAEQACQNDHRADVQAVFAWAIGGSGAMTPVAPTAWPTTCVALNDLVEADLGNTANVGIYQRVFGTQAEAGCRNDHRADVQAVFAWAIPTPAPTPAPTPVPAPASPPPPVSVSIGEVLHVVASPVVAQDRTIWIGTATGGVLRSTSAGASFTQVTSGLTNLAVNALLPSPNIHIDGVVLAATNNGIARSTDGGQTWAAAVGLPVGRIGGLAVSPRFDLDGTFYAVADVGGLYQSTNGGATWSSVHSEYLSGLPIGAYLGMTATPGRGDRIHIFAWTSTNLLVSDDRGASFRTVIGRKALPSGLQISAVAVHPNWGYNAMLWIGSELHGLYRTTNAGESFHNVIENPDDVLGRINVIVLSPLVTRDGTIAVGTAKSGLFLTRSSVQAGLVDDPGGPSSWSQRNVNLAFNNVRGLAFSNAYKEDRTIFAAGATEFAFTHSGANDWFTYPRPVGPTS